MTEKGKGKRGVTSRSPFPRGLIRRLSKSGYKITRSWLNVPTVAQVFAAIESGEQIWLYQGWKIVKKRQRSLKRRAKRANAGVSGPDLTPQSESEAT